jgi:hypothetical protein
MHVTAVMHACHLTQCVQGPEWQHWGSYLLLCCMSRQEVLTGLLVLAAVLCCAVLCCRLWSKVVAGAPRENTPFDKTALPSFTGKPVV